MATSSGLIRQAGAIPIRGGEVCLVTSRSGKRWVIPKGCLEPGKTSGEIALQEAWEEAGVVGILDREPVGSYLYEKAGFTCHVTVFLMQVSETSDTWPECSIRQRRWFTPALAVARVEEAALRDLIRGVGIVKVS